LIALGVCIRGNNSDVIFARSVKIDLDSEHILSLSITRAETINILNSLIIIHGKNKEKMADEIETKVGKSWKESSKKRNINSLLKFNDFANNYLNN
jgi:hypothetical protein